MVAERNLAIIDAETRPIAVAHPGPRLGLPTPNELEALKAYGQLAMASGMAPKHINSWETAVVTMRYAHQLGVDEFTGLQNIWVIGGKPSMNASLMHALILRDHGDDAIHVRVSTAERCELVCKRRNATQASLVTYTMAEATAAGLPTTNATWKKYPTDMLFARAISRAGRQIFRDSTMGLYIPEELGGNVIEAHGEIIEMEPSTPSNVHAIGGASYSAVLSDRPVPPPGAATEEQFKRIAVLAKQKGLKSKAEIQAAVGKPVQNLTPDEAESLIARWELDLTPSVEEATESAFDEMIGGYDGDTPLQSDLGVAVAGASGADKYTA